MARVTVEDSLQHVKNRFELVLLSAKRARDLTMSGIDPEVPWDNDKPTVVALREIAAGKIKADYLLKKSPEAKVPAKPAYQVIDDNDFDMDEDANAALIAALSAAGNESKSKSHSDIDEETEE